MTTTPKRPLQRLTSSTQRPSESKGALPLLSFDSDSHVYTYDGVPVMSVTQVLKHLFPQKYKGVPKNVLERAKDHGNKIHSMIEEYALTHSEDSRYNLIFEGINYEMLEKEHNILITSCDPGSLGDFIHHVIGQKHMTGEWIS